jgi:hypothetical protein
MPFDLVEDMFFVGALVVVTVIGMALSRAAKVRGDTNTRASMILNAVFFVISVAHFIFYFNLNARKGM